MTNKRATVEAFDALHLLVTTSQTEELSRNLERARLPKTLTVTDDAGVSKQIPNPDYEPLNTRLLQTAIKLLKDNGIDAPATSPRFTNLLDQLRDIQVEELPDGDL